jgi:uncharacterized protein
MLRAALVACLVVIAGSAPAGPFEDATAAYDRGDYATAMLLFRPLAEEGDPVAQYALGFMYHFGAHGIPQDHAEAFTWLRRAAHQGNELAQINLGFMYLDGEGVPPDYVQAHMWFNLAAAASKADKLNFAAENRDMVAANMTPAQIAEAQRLARDWKPKPER